MNSDRWLLLSPWLERALELSAEERPALLATLAGEDPQLAAELVRLLARQGAVESEGFLGRSGGVFAAEPSLAGQAFGAYTLVAPIGVGGMGSVWRARRNDGRFEGEVAVKLLNAALLGRGGEERFRREGVILARLAHPHIARLIDAGISALGQPFLVLELVRGEPIDRYCDRCKLQIESRLALFLDVLAAVSNAHANLVVHRDIKPSNVYVAADGEVKLLDFGIAKLLEGEGGSGEPTALTQDAGRAFTPEFAAPEQISGGVITTATDVHALGALLYLLLSGRGPMGDAVRSPVELLRAIAESEPQRLSEAAADPRTRTSAELDESAARRDSTPERLRRLLRGDLDTIVAKALKKRPEERYPSVAALAEDLARYRAQRPILARPDRLAYRAAKFVRRRRVPVALAALATVALLAGIATIARQSQREKAAAAVAAEQRDFALHELSRAEAINELNSFLLTEAAPGGKPFTVGDLLARAERIVGGPSPGPAGAAGAAGGEGTHDQQLEMMIAVGRELHSQDEIARARELLTAAYERARTSPHAATRARAACALAPAMARSGDVARAESLIDEGLAQLPDEPIFALPRIFCLRLGADVSGESVSDAERTLARRLAAQQLLRSSGQGSPLLEVRLATELADAYRIAGRDREANDAFGDAAARLDALGYGNSETAGTLFNNWALAVRTQGRPLEAERLFRRAMEISSSTAGEDSVTPFTLTNLGYTLADLHRFEEAKRFADRAYELARRQHNTGPMQQALMLRARLGLRTGEIREAAKLMAELEQSLRQLPADHLYRTAYESQMGLLAEARGDLAAAVASQNRAIAAVESDPARAMFHGLFLLRRSGLELKEGRPVRARDDAARALDLVGKEVETGSTSFWVGTARLELARALVALGETERARTEIAGALEHLEPTLGAEHPDTLSARRLAAQIDSAAGAPPPAGTSTSRSPS